MAVRDHNAAIRRAVKQTRSTLNAVESLALGYVNRGTDSTGRELTRTEYRTALCDEINLLREQLREINEIAIRE
jgi:hypothetical protein